MLPVLCYNERDEYTFKASLYNCTLQHEQCAFAFHVCVCVCVVLHGVVQGVSDMRRRVVLRC